MTFCHFLSEIRIMALDISNDRVGIAIAEHPNSNSKEENCEENNITLGHTIPYMPSRHQRGKGKGKKIFENASIQVRKEKVKDELNVLIKEFGIVGFIVGWPLEPSGLPGANCGQVLHLLDFLAGEFLIRYILNVSLVSSPFVLLILNHDIVLCLHYVCI